MHVDAILCDAARVREGLLHMLGGGITRLWREEFPANMGVDLALLVTVTTGERTQAHTLSIEIRGSDGELIADIQGQFDLSQQDPSHLDPWEEAQWPLVISLAQAAIPEEGEYRIEVLIDGQSRRSLGFKASPRQKEE